MNKQMLIIPNQVIAFILACLFLLPLTPLQAQKKGKPRIQMNYFKKSDGSRELVVSLKERVERKMEPIPGLNVNLYLNEISDSTRLISAPSNQAGMIPFRLSESILNYRDSSGKLTFFATVENEEAYQDADDDLTIAEAELKVETHDRDSIKEVIARLSELGVNGSEIPVENVAVRFFVQRYFTLLPVGEAFVLTNEEGEASIEFPLDIPGDSTGNLVLVVKVDDHDDYGTLEARKTLPWGTRLETENLLEKRALWARKGKSPIFLVILANGTIFGVWFVILYIIFQMFKLKREAT